MLCIDQPQKPAGRQILLTSELPCDTLIGGRHRQPYHLLQRIMTDHITTTAKYHEVSIQREQRGVWRHSETLRQYQNRLKNRRLTRSIVSCQEGKRRTRNIERIKTLEVLYCDFSNSQRYVSTSWNCERAASII